ncbi:hypothetical protein [Kibdelosporangium phytohabitans]|nr:hypothetical protein [Kibdelosporangium phytohabitans]MBE1461801.1 hypothetical protein [Kibdelosporangium phytohabitans]
MTAPVPHDTAAILKELVSEWRLVWDSFETPTTRTTDDEGQR